MTTPRIAFCITVKGRTQHLKETLPGNLADNADYDNLVFVILDYNSPDDLELYLQTFHSGAIERGRIVVYKNYLAGAFRMAHAKNMAHRCGMLEGADILVNLDADNFTGPGFARYIADRFTCEEAVFLWAPMQKGKMDRGISGRIVVNSHDYMKAGGYDERFRTWSPDDKDFNIRLRRMGITALEIEQRYLSAVRHTDKMRFKDYPEAESIPYESNEPKDTGTTCVNFEGYGVGIVWRNFERQDIYIDALPTRIFGIGMHKTGTTSLHHALLELDIDSVHWPSAHWAKAVYLEMTGFGRSQTLENHFAACDLPIPLLFKELDLAYPGSKFIFTFRSEEVWLRSLEHHFSYTHNKWRKYWDTDPFTHKVHTLLYGRRTFDREVMLARYRRHILEVTEYFRNRPRDLLLFDTHKETTWDHLCDFLGKPHPAVPYPKENGTHAT